MSMNYGFKKLSEADIVQSPKPGAHFVLEENGVLKRIAAENIEVGDSGGSGGVSSWNDLTDKPFYDEGEEISLPIFNMEPTVLENTDIGSNTFVWVLDLKDANNGVPVTLEDDVLYDVTINGQTYRAKAVLYPAANKVYLGDFSIMLGQPSGQLPFIILWGKEMYITTPGETHSVSISKVITAIEKEITPEKEITFIGGELPGMYINMTDFDFSSIALGDILTITIDDKTYTTTVKELEGITCFGNLKLATEGMEEIEDTGEPFIGMYAGMSGLYYAPPTAQYTISLDKKIDDSNYQNIVTNETIDCNFSTQNVCYIGEGSFEIALEIDATYRVSYNGEMAESTVEPTPEGPALSVELPAGVLITLKRPSDVDTYALWVQDSSSRTSSHTVCISGFVSGVKPLEKKYLPAEYTKLSLFNSFVAELIGEINYIREYMYNTSDDLRELGEEFDSFKSSIASNGDI